MGKNKRKKENIEKVNELIYKKDYCYHSGLCSGLPLSNAFTKTRMRDGGLYLLDMDSPRSGKQGGYVFMLGKVGIFVDNYDSGLGEIVDIKVTRRTGGGNYKGKVVNINKEAKNDFIKMLK